MTGSVSATADIDVVFIKPRMSRPIQDRPSCAFSLKSADCQTRALWRHNSFFLKAVFKLHTGETEKTAGRRS